MRLQMYSPVRCGYPGRTIGDGEAVHMDGGQGGLFSPFSASPPLRRPGSSSVSASESPRPPGYLGHGIEHTATRGCRVVSTPPAPCRLGVFLYPAPGSGTLRCLSLRCGSAYLQLSRGMGEIREDRGVGSGRGYGMVSLYWESREKGTCKGGQGGRAAGLHSSPGAPELDWLTRPI